VNDVLALLPIALLAFGAAAAIAFDRLLPADERAAAWLAAAIAVGAATAAALAGTGDDALGGLIRRDGASVFLTSLVCVGAAAAFAVRAGTSARPAAGAHLAQMLVACAGAALLVVAADLILVFVATEIVFMSLFLLIDATQAPRSSSASRAFFILGGSASALLAAGVGLVWSETGSFAIGALASADSIAGQAGTALLLVGLAFFAGLAPFHFWLPSAVAAASLPTAMLVAVVPRIAAFGALMRCASAISANAGSAIDWRACVAILAAASLVVGGFGALRETSLRRIVAHLAVAFGGQIAVAVAAGVGAGDAIALALLVYVVVVPGLLGAIALVGSADPRLADLRGFARRRPLFVATVAVLAIATAGLPPTIGVFARLAVFERAANAQLAWLVIVAALAAVLMAASGLRIVFACFEGGEAVLAPGRVISALVAVAALVALAGGIAPGPWIQLTQAVRF
jgi:NADH-quinone oxidoreductase subunit N